MSTIIFGGLDIETTGLDQEKGHRIIEVALTLHTEDGRRIGEYTTRINAERPIDPAAEAVHGISAESLIGCPTWPIVAPKLSAIMQRCTYIVAHNGEGFDLPFIVRELLRAGVPVPPEIRLIDTMLQGRWATPDGSVPNLGALAFACDVEYDRSKAHAALYDVEVMMACFFKHLPTGFFTLPTKLFTLVKET